MDLETAPAGRRPAQRTYVIVHAKSYAKLNLYLDVGERRADGFHDIETIFQTIDLADELKFESRPDSITLACEHAGLDTGADNLIQRAAHALQACADSNRGAHIQLRKRIPIAAGLAGGSGNAAATLMALNELWELNLAGDELGAIALELGSDVPYCLRGGTMAGRGRGEQLQPLAPVNDVAFVLVHPAIEISTAWVYQHPDLPRRPMGSEATERLRDAISALEARDWQRTCTNAMQNIVFRQHPQLADLRQRLLDGGCITAMMSGSGPTIFGIAKTREIAGRIATKLKDVSTTVATPADRGVRIAMDGSQSPP